MRAWLLPLLAGAAAGILSGFGVGGGTLLLLYLSGFAGLPQAQAQGINLLYFLPAAAASLPAHFKNGYVERSVLLPAIAAGLAAVGLKEAGNGAGHLAHPAQHQLHEIFRVTRLSHIISSLCAGYPFWPEFS